VYHIDELSGSENRRENHSYVGGAESTLRNRKPTRHSEKMNTHDTPTEWLAQNTDTTTTNATGKSLLRLDTKECSFFF
jgi:hypothetical protein